MRAAADDDVLRHLPEGDPEPGGGLPQGLRVPRRGQGRLHLGEHHPEDRLGRGGGEGNLFFLNLFFSIVNKYFPQQLNSPILHYTAGQEVLPPRPDGRGGPREPGPGPRGRDEPHSCVRGDQEGGGPGEVQGAGLRWFVRWILSLWLLL